VAEAVDRLELVADEEQLGLRHAQQLDELALKRVGVLELVDHDRAETQSFALADRLVVAQEVARVQLEVLEVERRLARLRLRIGGGEAGEELLEQHAVADRRFVECGLLDGVARLLVRRRPLARRAEAGELHQSVGAAVALEQREQLRRVAALELGRGRVLGEAAGRLAQLLDPALELRHDLRREVEVASRRSAASRRHR